MRFTLECRRDDDGRLEGELSFDGAASPIPFSGNLELLRLLDDHGPAQRTPTRPVSGQLGGGPDG
jgi:hypothetical protein